MIDTESGRRRGEEVGKEERENRGMQSYRQM